MTNVLVVLTIVAVWIATTCIHEFGHAIVAYWGGDISVKYKGYLTLNPLKYLHPTFSIIMPTIFLLVGGVPLPGAAVYVDRSRLQNRLWHSAVSLAGPAASALCTAILLLLFQGLPQDPSSLPNYLAIALGFLIYIEILSILLNLTPLPPLDGYGTIRPWLPQSWQVSCDRFGRYGVWVLFGLLWLLKGPSIWSNWAIALTDRLGINRTYIAMGFDLFHQQRDWIIVAIVLGLVVAKHRGWRPRW